MGHTRRGIMKAAALLGLGAKPAMTTAARAFLHTPVGGGVEAATGLAPPHPSVAVGMTEKAWQLLNRELQEAERRFEDRQVRRINGLDPDLWERQSGSLAYRVNLQRRRDDETRAQLREMSMRLWPGEW